MTKTALIAQVAGETGVTKAAANSVVAALLKAASQSLKKEGRFALYGLGIFTVVKRPKRKGRNPRTSEPVVIKAHKVVRFKTAKSLKDSVK
jgi:DNA-binding protein HU-beta